MIAMVWLVSFASNLGSLLIYEEETYTKGWSCVSVMSASVDLAYQIYTTLVLLCIPLLIMAILYGNVIFALKTGTVKLENPLNSLPSMECMVKRLLFYLNFYFFIFYFFIFSSSVDGECRRSSIGTWVLETIKAGDRGSKVQDQNGIDIGSVQLTITQQEQKQQKQQQSQRPSLPGLIVQQQEVYSRRCTTASLTASSLFGGGARHSSVDLDNCFPLRSNNQVIRPFRPFAFRLSSPFQPLSKYQRKKTTTAITGKGIVGKETSDENVDHIGHHFYVMLDAQLYLVDAGQNRGSISGINDNWFFIERDNFRHFTYGTIMSIRLLR